MAKGNVTLPLANVSDGTVDDRIELLFTPLANSSGGFRMRVPEFRFLGASSIRVTGIQCADIGTLYGIEIRSRRYQVDAFQMRIAPGEQTAEARTLMVDPTKVVAIDVPPYESLDPPVQDVLKNSEIPEFPDLANPGNTLQGPLLYLALQPLQLACLLNLVRKASHRSSASVWSKVQKLRRVEQDRVFALVDNSCFDFVSRHDLFEEAPNALHTPMPGFQRKESFKTKNDTTAGLQVSFMQDANGQWAVDIDIDETAGLAHKFEAARNTLFGIRTHPYLIRELLVRNSRELDPGYTFIFDS